MHLLLGELFGAVLLHLGAQPVGHVRPAVLRQGSGQLACAALLVIVVPVGSSCTVSACQLVLFIVALLGSAGRLAAVGLSWA